MKVDLKAKHKQQLRYESSVRRKHRSMQRNAAKAAESDQRTKAERGYDAAVQHGVASAQAGTCIAAIAGTGGTKVKYNPALLVPGEGGALHALYGV